MKTLSVADALKRTLVDERSTGRIVKTGLGALDELIGGLRPGSITLLAGLPGMGQTQTALRLAFHAASVQKCRTLFASTRLNAGAAASLAATWETGRVDVHQTHHHACSPEDQRHTAGAAASLKATPLYLLDAFGLRFDEVCDEAEEVFAPAGAAGKLLVLDSLYELSPAEPCAAHEAEFGNIMEILSSMTESDPNLAVLATADLRPCADKDGSRRPTARDLPCFHAVARHADVLLLLHRPEYFNFRKARNGGTIIVARNRFGPTGQVGLDFNEVLRLPIRDEPGRPRRKRRADEKTAKAARHERKE